MYNQYVKRILVAMIEFGGGNETYTASFSNGALRSLFRKYINLINNLSRAKYQIHIQVHPMEDLSKINNLIEGIDVTISRGDALKQIEKSDIIIGSFSTIIFDALLAGKPAINFLPWHEEFDLLSIDYSKSKNVSTCRNYKEIEQIIKKIDSGEIIFDKRSNKKYLSDMIDCSGEESLEKFEYAIFGR